MTLTNSPPIPGSRVEAVFLCVYQGGPLDIRCHGEHAPWLSTSRQSGQRDEMENSEDLQKQDSDSIIQGNNTSW